MIKLCVFLGNPGKEYERTRHNVAWMAADRLPFSGIIARQEKFNGEIARVKSGDETLLLLFPGLFMNRSGESVSAAMRFYKVLPQELLIVHDELELPFGEAGFRYGGGLSGHNGLRSVAQSIGSRDFFRFRIGIGRPSRGDVSSYVLSRFSPEEEPVLSDILIAAGKLLESCLTGDCRSIAARNPRVRLQ